MKPVSLVITFHSENLLAHNTLLSVRRMIDFASRLAIEIELLIILDSPTFETNRVVHNFCNSYALGICYTVKFSDVSKARNFGISVATGEYVAICDGDDYYSENWLVASYTFLQNLPVGMRDKLILHPEYVVNFGQEWSYARQIDTQDNRLREGLFEDNWWCAWVFASIQIFHAVPYIETHGENYGFGFEDWWWNCETIFYDFEHRIVPRTVGFYRRRLDGRNNNALADRTLMHHTKLFSRTQ